LPTYRLALLAIARICANVELEAPGTNGSTPFDENALRWILLWGLGWIYLGGGVSHTILAKSTAKAIEWRINGFQYEIGLAGIYAAHSRVPSTWAGLWRPRRGRSDGLVGRVDP